MITDASKLEYRVTKLLQSHARDEYARDKVAPHVAKVSLMMGHLYSDLRLKNRFMMGIYMKQYFPTLAKSKPSNKLWKKYIYDTIGEVAPACATCKDQINCFACDTALK
jgi:nitrogen fixation protein NifQ